ncbi:MAG TPA: peptidoglycan editing factor PgeF [Blastocatellia bacterium]|jgi:YfiH family protein|nr:peptidoglycan editing factor PgeF [Blastocatellia bacterium]
MEEIIEDDFVDDAFAMREREIDTPAGPARLAYVVCEPLEEAGFINGFSTRLGGVSPLPSGALNLAHFKGDERENVSENRRRFLKALGAESYEIITAKQTHSVDRSVVESAEQARQARFECDALLTRASGVLIGIQTADCLPVLIGDPSSGAMAAVHAGWRGTAGRITERAIADLMMNHGMNSRTAIAALGPAACSECYEVGDDVIELYRKEFGYWRNLLVNFKEGGKAHLDIQAANAQQLAFCGFSEDQIHIAPYCTMHQNELFFSYRREGGGRPSVAGRSLSVIGKA